MSWRIAGTWIPIGVLLATTATCALPGYDFVGAGAAGGGAGASGAAGGSGGLGSAGGQGGLPSGGGGQGANSMACPPPVEIYDPDSCEGANLEFDEDNCGACGRSCLGAPCTQGKCEYEVFGVQEFAADMVPIGPDRLFVAVLNAAGGTWTLGEGSLQALLGPTRPTALTVYEDELYFADRRDLDGVGGAPTALGGVYTLDSSLTTATQIAQERGAFGLHIDDVGIYFIDIWYGGVSVWLFDEPELRRLYEANDPLVGVLGVNDVKGVITAGTDYAYFAAELTHDSLQSGAHRVPKRGSATLPVPPEMIFPTPDTDQKVTDLLAIDGYLYIAVERRNPAGGACFGGKVLRAPIIPAGIGDPEELVANAECPHAFDVDEHFVYWLDRAAPDTGTISRYSRYCDLPVEVLRDGLDEPQFLRVTAEAMFLGEWLGNGDTRLSRSTKTRDP